MDVNDLTLAEVAEVETISGQPFADMAEAKAPKGKLMQAIVFILKRKQDPKFTFEMAGNLTMSEMNKVIEGDPT